MGAKKVIVIGAGVSGLTAGIYALKYGYDVDIYERNANVGGMCTGWKRKGSYIDGCIHWLTESDRGVLNDLWHEIGGLSEAVRIHHFDVYCQVEAYGEKVNFYTDPDRLNDELMRFAKTDNDRKLVSEFIWGVKKNKRNLITTHKAYHLWRLWDGIKFFFHIFPLVKVLKSAGQISIGDFAAQFDSKVLQYVLTHNLMHTPYSLFSMLSTYGGLCSKNSGVPLGGSQAFSNRIRDKFLSGGGHIIFRSDVSEIVIEDGHAKGILLADGTLVEADYIIPACDVHYTLASLLKGKYQIPDFQFRDSQPEKFPVYSGFVFSFRTRKDISGIMPNRYVPCKPMEICGQTFDTLCLKHFGYDPSLSYDGYTVLQVILFTDDAVYDRLAELQRADYVALKQRIGNEMLERLNKVDDGGYGELELLDVATPLTFTHYVNAYRGSFMAYMFTTHGKQMRVRNDILPIDNLALANHWMMVPGGVPVAAMQGKYAAQTIAHISKHGNPNCK